MLGSQGSELSKEISRLHQFGQIAEICCGYDLLLPISHNLNHNNSKHLHKIMPRDVTGLMNKPTIVCKYYKLMYFEIKVQEGLNTNPWALKVRVAE